MTTDSGVSLGPIWYCFPLLFLFSKTQEENELDFVSDKTKSRISLRTMIIF